MKVEVIEVTVTLAKSKEHALLDYLKELHGEQRGVWLWQALPLYYPWCLTIPSGSPPVKDAFAFMPYRGDWVDAINDIEPFLTDCADFLNDGSVIYRYNYEPFRSSVSGRYRVENGTVYHEEAKTVWAWQKTIKLAGVEQVG